MNTRVCKACAVEKPIEDYHKAPGYKEGRRPQCKVCYAEYQKQFLLDTDKRRGYWIKHKYGITMGEHDKMLDEQNGGCAVCTLPLTEPQVDHDHATGKVRGLLCRHCNTGLGHFREDPKLFASALAYLERNK